jgi:hypothetical protein
MGWEHPPETVWKAQELYCCDRLSFDRVAELTGVSATTLKGWADKYGWREKREEIAKAESDIRYGTILGRQKVLERLIMATSGMEASQLSFAVSALENLALKQQEMAASGKIPSGAAEKRNHRHQGRRRSGPPCGHREQARLGARGSGPHHQRHGQGRDPVSGSD